MNRNQTQAEEHIKQANAFHRQGDYEKAIAAYREAIALMPDAPTYQAYQFMIGDMLEEMGQYEKAVEAYQKTVHVVSHYDEAWFNLGRCLMRLGRDKEALQAIDRFLEITESRSETEIVEPRNWLEMNERIGEAWYNGAVIRAKQGEVEEAERYLEKALEVRPGLKRRVAKEALLRNTIRPGQ